MRNHAMRFRGRKSPGALRERMVDQQIEGRGVRDAAVLSAMRKVPRDRFVPNKLAALAYDDTEAQAEARAASAVSGGKQTGGDDAEVVDAAGKTLLMAQKAADEVTAAAEKAAPER